MRSSRHRIVARPALIGALLLTTLGAAESLPSDLASALENARHAVYGIDGAVVDGGIDPAVPLRSSNPRQGYGLRFERGGVAVALPIDGGTRHVALRLQEANGTASPLATARQVTARRVTTAYGDDLEEWHDNGAEGLEHGFTLRRAPDGKRLRLVLAVDGASPRQDGADIAFADEAGQAVAAYRGLRVDDAAGRRIDARMRAEARGIVIEADLAGATYPVVVDPLVVVERPLAPSNGAYVAGTRFGTWMDADDTTLAVRASDALYVFARGAAGAWVPTTRIDAVEAALGYGDVVVDGGTIATAGLTPAGDAAVHVFSRRGLSWYRSGSAVAPPGVDTSYFGRSLALSGDMLAVSGATHVVPFLGSQRVDIYRRAPAPVPGDPAAVAWTHIQTLMPPPEAGVLDDPEAGYPGTDFGLSLAMDGALLLVGMPLAANPAWHGTIFAYRRAGDVWVEDAAARQGGVPGHTIDLDGATAILGGLQDAVLIRELTPAGWVTRATLTHPSPGSFDRFGWSVAIRGGLAAVSSIDAASGDPIAPYAVFAYERVGSTWTLRRSRSIDDAEYDFYEAELGTVAISGRSVLLGLPRLDGPAAAEQGAVADVPIDGGAVALVRAATPLAPGFGASVAVSGLHAAVGAPGDHPASPYGEGAVYVFRRVSGSFGWAVVARVTRPSWSAGNQHRIGERVALDGDRLVIGLTPLGATASLRREIAAVHRRDYTSWPELTLLQGAGFAPRCTAVAAGGGSIAVAYSAVLAGRRVRVFTSDGALVAEVRDITGGGYGDVIDIDGSTLVVGAPGADGDRGAAVVCRPHGRFWIPVAVLRPAAAGTGFGIAVGVSGDEVAVGAPGAGDGAVHAYRRTPGGWLLDDLVAAPSGAGRFGDAVAIDGGRLLVGAPASRGAFGVRTGAAYLFLRSPGGWHEAGRMIPGRARHEAGAGSTVALSGAYAAVGSAASPIGPGLPASGAVSIFEIVSASVPSPAPALPIADG